MSKTINVTLPEDVLRKLNEYQKLVQECNAKQPGKKKPNYAEAISVFVTAAMDSPVLKNELNRMREQVRSQYEADLERKNKELANLVG